MRRIVGKWIRGAMVAVALVVVTQSVQAQTLVGARLGVYTDREDLFVGGEVLTPVADRVYLNPNVEYVFVDNGTFGTFNFDLHYDFPLEGGTFLWAGGGLGVLYFNPEGPAGSDTDIGANILFGVGFLSGGPVIPYVQAKVIAADNSDFVVGFGLRF